MLSNKLIGHLNRAYVIVSRWPSGRLKAGITNVARSRETPIVKDRGLTLALNAASRHRKDGGMTGLSKPPRDFQTSLFVSLLLG